MKAFLLNLFLQSILFQALHVAVRSEPIACPRISRRYNATDSDGNKIKLQTRGPIGRYAEVSAVAFSPRQKAPSGEPVIFAISDGGAGTRIGAWDSWTGKRLLTLRISTSLTTNHDWEALTIGSCGNTGRSSTCLYIADTGDNAARESGGRRSQRGNQPARIIKIKEPKLDEYEDEEYIPNSDIAILNIDYKHSSSPVDYADVEAVFLDHTGWGGSVGDIYLVSKWGGNRAKTLTRLFQISASEWPGGYNGQKGHHSPRVVGKYDYRVSDGQVKDGQLLGKTWTGGEMSFDGTMIGLTTTKESALFLRCPGESVADALAARNAGTHYCMRWNQPTGRSQVESFSFDVSGKRSLSIPEGNNPRMGWTEFEYDLSKAKRVCAEPGSQQPTMTPTRPPTNWPTSTPTKSPTRQPTSRPTEAPTEPPTMTLPPESENFTDNGDNPNFEIPTDDDVSGGPMADDSETVPPSGALTFSPSVETLSPSLPGESGSPGTTVPTTIETPSPSTPGEGGNSSTSVPTNLQTQSPTAVPTTVETPSFSPEVDTPVPSPTVPPSFTSEAMVMPSNRETDTQTTAWTGHSVDDDLSMDGIGEGGFIAILVVAGLVCVFFGFGLVFFAVRKWTRAASKPAIDYFNKGNFGETSSQQSKEILSTEGSTDNPSDDEAAINTGDVESEARSKEEAVISDVDIIVRSDAEDDETTKLIVIESSTVCESVAQESCYVETSIRSAPVHKSSSWTTDLERPSLRVKDVEFNLQTPQRKPLSVRMGWSLHDSPLKSAVRKMKSSTNSSCSSTMASSTDLEESAHSNNNPSKPRSKSARISMAGFVES